MTGRPGRIVEIEGMAPVRWTVEEGRFLLRGEDTDGLFSLLEFTTMPGLGPPAHVHDAEDETFVVTHGRYEFWLGDRRHIATPGTVLYGPRGLVHAFRNLENTPSTMLCLITPGGSESMFEELAELVSHPTPPDPATIAALAAKYQVSHPSDHPASRASHEAGRRATAVPDAERNRL